MPMNDICANCKWFRQTEPDKGMCHRYPPVPYPTGPGQVTAFWPVVQVSTGCGEWTPAIFTAKDMPPKVELQ